MVESEIPSGWWWLSFADPRKPKDTQFLGALIVEGSDLAAAMQRAWDIRQNPGGEVMGSHILEGRVPSEAWRNRLLTKGEALELVAWANERFGA